MTPAGPTHQRLVADREAMSRWYPRFWLVRPLAGPVRWEGFLKPFRTRLATFKVAIEYRPRETGVPVIWIVKPEVSRRNYPAHPHLNADGSACAYFVPDGDYEPSRDRINVLVDLAFDWLQRHVYWVERAVWPGPEAPHDPHGVVTELQGKPNAACVCGSGGTFESCHGRIYRAGARKQRQGALHQVSFRHAGSVRETLATLRRRWGGPGLARALPHLGPRDTLL